MRCLGLGQTRDHQCFNCSRVNVRSQGGWCPGCACVSARWNRPVVDWWFLRGEGLSALRNKETAVCCACHKSEASMLCVGFFEAKNRPRFFLSNSNLLEDSSFEISLVSAVTFVLLQQHSRTFFPSAWKSCRETVHEAAELFLWLPLKQSKVESKTFFICCLLFFVAFEKLRCLKKGSEGRFTNTKLEGIQH